MSLNIEKSDNDTRNYIYKKLKNNLEVIIVRDNEETMCGACLNVNIGSASEDVPGLAHFLEHMLFMGSKKYPKSNNFMSKINKSGGMTNAYTSDTDTNYYFICSSDTYLSNLDIFGHFIVDPLLSKKYVKKEISNVNSESNKNIVDNNWLLQDIIKTLFNKEHAINHYTAGTTESLSIPHIYDKLKEFKKQFYTAERMSLILFINDTINQENIDSLLDNIFSLIPTKGKKEKIKFGEIIKGNQIVKYIPFTDSHLLRIIFQVKTIENILESPLIYIYYLLNLRCIGSLFDILSSKSLITKLDCGEINNFDDYTLFSIDCELTDKGFKYYKTIYNVIKSYVDYLIAEIEQNNKILEKHFLENLQMNKNNFTFWEKPDINSLMSLLSQQLKYNIPREILLNYDLKIDSFDKITKNIKQIFDDYSCSICIGSKKIKLKDYIIYPNYKAKYIVEDIKFTPNKNIFSLPINNNYICYNPIIQQISQYGKPKQIDNINFLSFYYGDNNYKSPIVDIKICIKLPQLLDSINLYVNVLLYYSASYNSIVKLKDLIMNAGYEFYFKLNTDSIYLNISGYTENIEKAIKIIKYMFSQKFTSEHYEQAKFELEQELKNFEYETVISKFATFSQEKIYLKFFMPDKMLKVLKSTTMDKLINIYNEQIKTARISMFCSGNITQELSKKLVKKIYKYINIKHIIEPLQYNNIKNYTENEMFIYRKNNKNINVLVALLFPLPEISIKDTKKWYEYILFCRLLEIILSNDFFYELRTEKEIGYVVKIKTSIYHNNLTQKIYIKFIVQSSNYTYDIILQEIMDFIMRHKKRIMNELSDIDYKEYIESEKNKLKKNFDTLAELTGYYFNSIVDESYQFDSKDILLKKIDSFTIDIFRSYFEKYIIKNTKLCFVI
jgi:secreted Zn-dependent insulinase-like peptidase